MSTQGVVLATNGRPNDHPGVRLGDQWASGSVLVALGGGTRDSQGSKKLDLGCQRVAKVVNIETNLGVILGTFLGTFRKVCPEMCPEMCPEKYAQN